MRRVLGSRFTAAPHSIMAACPAAHDCSLDHCIRPAAKCRRAHRLRAVQRRGHGTAAAVAAAIEWLTACTGRILGPKVGGGQVSGLCYTADAALQGSAAASPLHVGASSAGRRGRVPRADALEHHCICAARAVAQLCAALAVTQRAMWQGARHAVARSAPLL